MGNTKFEAVIWDVDGVLIDSEPTHYAALQSVCARHGFAISAAENAAMLGMGLPDMWREISRGHRLSGTLEDWIEAIVSEYVSTISHEHARPGAAKTVRHLARLGVPLAAVSTAERRVVEANLEAVGIRQMMQAVVAREDVSRTKPDPEPYLRAAGALSIDPARCIAVEDTPTGIRAAKASGMFTVCWPNAMTRSLDLNAADRVIESLDDLPWLEIVRFREPGGIRGRRLEQSEAP